MRGGPRLPILNLSPYERSERLEQWTRRPKTGQGLARRPRESFYPPRVEQYGSRRQTWDDKANRRQVA